MRPPDGYHASMEIRFVAGFGPIVPDTDRSRTFWERSLGIELEEAAPGYFTSELEGVRAFALWPLSQAAESCFGSADWPADRPVPQAWIEFDVATVEEVANAAAELEAGGHALLLAAKTEPWGQTVTRLQSPEGLLVGVTYTPWMHETKETDRSDAS
jgi:catechol 2,3-dioxygenase-like lactoylglutathione lyase family enzyme